MIHNNTIRNIKNIEKENQEWEEVLKLANKVSYDTILVQLGIDRV